jgi:hypothetical protein
MSNRSAKTVSIPIFRNFDDRAPIGSLIVMRDELPATPDFSFAICYREGADGRFELLAVSPVVDVKGKIRKPVATIGGAP